MKEVNILENNDLINKFLNTDITRLGAIYRYNNKHRNHEENVAEHSFYVMHMVMEILDQYKFHDVFFRLRCMELALVHDVAESITGDISFDTKDLNGELSYIVNQAEVKAIEEYFPQYIEIYNRYLMEEDARSVAFLIVKIADTASVVKFAELEKDLGNNTKEFVEIRYNSMIRLKELISELEAKINPSK